MKRAALVLFLLSLAAPASARRITPELRRAIAIVADESGAAEARALEKLLHMEGREQIPLSRGFVDAAIGRESVPFLRRVVATLGRLRGGRPYLDRAIAELSEARGALERHGYLNWGGDGPHPSDRLVLADHRVDEAALGRDAARARTADDVAGVLREALSGRGLEVTTDRDGNVVATLHGKRPETIVLGARRDPSGADVAALAEAGRALAGRPFEKTIRLVLFADDGVGAGDRFAARSARDGAPVEAVFLLDAIAHGRGAKLQLHTDRDERSLYLGSEVQRAAARLDTELSPVGILPIDRAANDGAASRVGAVPTVRIGAQPGDAHQADLHRAGEVIAAALEATARAALPIVRRAGVTTRTVPADSPLGPALSGEQPERGARDELYDERGRVRPAYQAVAGVLVEQSKDDAAAAARAMHVESRDDSRYRPYPRVFTAKEFVGVRRGLEQLERVMQATLRDIYSPRSRLLEDGILTQAELDVAEGFRKDFVGRFTPKTRFGLLARPDLVRRADGKFTMLELNQGYLGGLPGIASTRALLKDANPELFDAAAVRPVEDFVVDLARQLKGMARRGGKVVFFNDGRQAFAEDSEDRYLAAELKKEGIEYVSSDTRRRLQTIRGRVYLVDDDGARERVDVVYSRKTWVPPEMEEAHVRGGVIVFPSPGAAVLESKNLYKKLPTLIRRLLNEEPVFGFLKTRSFGAGAKLDAPFLDEVLKDPRDWVIKSANDAAGDGVLVGRTATPAQLAAFKAKILANPAGWDAQEYTAPETLNGERVDFDPYLVSTRGRVLIPAGAMVRSAKLDKRFSDHPRFLDAWVLDEAKPRDYLAKARPRAPRGRARR